MLGFFLDCYFLIFDGIIIFGEQPFGLIMDEITQNLEAICLFDWLLLEKFCNYSDSRPQILLLIDSFLNLTFNFLYGVLSLLVHSFKFLYFQQQTSSFIHELVVAILKLLTSCFLLSKHRNLFFQHSDIRGILLICSLFLSAKLCHIGLKFDNFLKLGISQLLQLIYNIIFLVIVLFPQDLI